MDLQLTAKTVNQQRDRRLPPGRWSRLRRAGAPLRPSRTIIRLDYAIVAWGGVLAAVHFYWAAGGTALNSGGPVDGGAAAYIAFIAVLGVIGGLVGLAIARAATRRIPRRPLLLLTRVAATLLLFSVATRRDPIGRRHRRQLDGGPYVHRRDHALLSRRRRAVRARRPSRPTRGHSRRASTPTS